MDPVELRNADEAKQYLTEGIWLQRISKPNINNMRFGLECALEATSAGHPIPPLGFIVDLGHVAFANDQNFRNNKEEAIGLPVGLARTYEDQVLGKLYSDYQFERSCDAVRRYQGRDKAKGMAFILNQMRERCNFSGVTLSPAIIRGLLEAQLEEPLTRGWDTISKNGGTTQLMMDQYEELISSTRRSPELLGIEDVFELEHKTALLEFGQRIALRQLVQASTRLESLLPQNKVNPLRGRQELPTRVLDEDTYPIGGYSSISTRGTIESLLHSQLAYMEPDGEERPDLFDIKFVRDELLYYSRDENQFLRRRRTFVFTLCTDLLKARVKDTELSYQRIVLVMATLVASIRKLSEWLSTDALAFQIVFVNKGEETLAHEQGLLQSVLREQIANGTVAFSTVNSMKEVEDLCSTKAKKSLCHCLLISAAGTKGFHADDTVDTQLVINKPTPELRMPVKSEDLVDEPPTALDGWVMSLERLLQLWV